jgi:hypothetical protein
MVGEPERNATGHGAGRQGKESSDRIRYAAAIVKPCPNLLHHRMYSNQLEVWLGNVCGAAASR